MKPTILIFAHFYLPGTRAGGPIRSISNLIENLGNEYDFKIITADRDIGDKVSYKNIQKNTWVQIGKAEVYYIPTKFINVLSLVKLIKSSNCSFYYLNSFFDPRFSFLPLFFRWTRLIPSKPILIAPRGEFSKAALNIKSFKKRLYLIFLKNLGLLKDAVWQASSDSEKNDIYRSLIGVSINKTSISIPLKNLKVAPDLLQFYEKIFISGNLASSSSRSNSSSGELLRNLNICFASRISKMKNLDFLLKILLKVRSKVVLNIHGPAEDLDYWSVCKNLIDQLPSNIQVNVYGAYKNEDVEIILGENDIFFLPTLGENFGHVIFEALKSGLPVLISDRTPWVNLEVSKAGWVGSLNEPIFFVETIEKLAKMSPNELQVYKDGAREYANNYLFTTNARDETKNLFEYMLKLNFDKN